MDRRRRRHELVGRDELGTLKVNTGNGFVPGHGQSFSVLLYHTRSGMFGTLTGTPAYTVNYTATAANVVYP